MRQPNASPARIARSTAARFNTGSAPGRPRHTGQTCEFGGAPNAVLQPQKILDAVSSCAGISRLKIGSLANETASRAPESAARIIARVYAIFIRLPTPYGPPLHPVFT